MANIPKKPQKGDRVLQSLYNTVCDIVDYLPSLNVVGDNKTTYVNHSAGGTTIHAIQPSFSTLNKSNEYIAGSGIVFTSGNIINAKLSAGPNINIDYNSGWLVISGTPAGSGGGGGGGSGYTYTGDGDLGSGHIFVDYSYTDPVICSNLRYIDDLLNYPISGDGIGSELHFTQIRDIKDGAGTQVDYHWNSIGDSTEEGGQLIKFIDGVCVNLNVSGGTYITTKFHQGVGYGDYTSASIDCNLSGSYDWYPHTSGFIAIVPQYDASQNITGGIISTNLHAGSGIAIDPQTGEITCTIEGGGGTTIIASGLQYPNYASLYNDDNGNVSGIGISFILPVSAGQEYKYYTDARDEDEEQEGTYKEYAFATYAPAEGETGDSRRAIANGVEFVPSANGYIRISVFDDGKHQGKCLRFYKGGDTSYEYATPLYRFHGFTNYEAGSGIAIESGIISCMLQTDTNVLSGITSTALTTGNPYNPTITGIAIGLSTAWAEDLANINKHTLVANKNKVLSSNNYGALVWADNVEPISPSSIVNFLPPKYNLLNLGENDAGIAASGMGTTYLSPVSKGSSIWYEGTATVAIWVPVEGSSVTAKHDVPNTSTNAWTTTDDGYVRLTVMDDGSNAGGCLKLHVGSNGVLPLHKYSAQLSGAAGIAIENGGIRNMIQPGTGLTSTAIMSTGENPIMTGISFELSTQYAADLASISGRLSATTNEDRILSSHNGILSWEENSAASQPLTTVFDLLSQGTNIQLTKLDDGKTRISSTGGGGGTTGGIPWPNYANLTNYSDELSCNKLYDAGYSGGWLRISYKGEAISGCYGVDINYNQIGLYTVGETSNVQQGNTWLIPIPPYAQFRVTFPSSVTHVYFDSQTWTQEQKEEYYSYICGLANDAWEFESYAENYKGNAEDAAYEVKSNYENYVGTNNIWSTSDYESYKNDAESYADNAAEQAQYASGCADNTITEYDNIHATEPTQGRAEGYKNSAIEAAEYAADYAHQAAVEADKAMYYYVLRRDHNNKTWYNNNYQEYNESYYPYDYSLEYPYHN